MDVSKLEPSRGIGQPKQHKVYEDNFEQGIRLIYDPVQPRIPEIMAQTSPTNIPQLAAAPTAATVQMPTAVDTNSLMERMLAKMLSMQDQDPRPMSTRAEPQPQAHPTGFEQILPPTPTKPTVDVVFSMPHFGDFLSRYHHAQLVGDHLLVLVYDTRYDGGGQFIPPETPEGETISIKVPSLRLANSAMIRRSLNFRLFCCDIFMVLLPEDEKKEGMATAEERDQAAMTMSEAINAAYATQDDPWKNEL